MGELRTPRRGGLPRPPGVGERKTSDARKNGARAVPAGLDAWGSRRRRTHRGWRGCGRPRLTSASTAPRQSHDRGASRTPPLTAGTKHALRRERQRMQLPHASQKVRGLCPRYYIRWTVEVTVRTVGNVGAIGHAGHPRQRCPGNHSTVVHRGRCTLRAIAKRTLRHMTQCMRFPRAYQWCAGCARGIGCVG